MADNLYKYLKQLSSKGASFGSTGITPAGISSAGFTPVVYESKPLDFSIPMQYMKERNDAYDKMYENVGNIEKAINSLPMDDSEREFLTNYSNDIKQRIQNFIDADDFRGAMRESQRLANSAVTDQKLLSRYYRFKDYEAARAELLKDNSVDELTKQRWLDENTYQAGLTENPDGTVNQWRATFNPIRNVKLDDVVSKAAQHVAERSYQNSYGSNNKGIKPSDYKPGMSSLGSVGVSSSSSNHYKTEKAITDVFNELMDIYPDEIAALQQDWENQVWIKNKLDAKVAAGEELTPVETSQLDIANRRLKKGAGIKNAAEYLWSLMGNTISNSAYTRTSSSYTTDNDWSEANQSQFAASLLNTGNTITTTTIGPSVSLSMPSLEKQQSNGISAKNAATRASSYIGSKGSASYIPSLNSGSAALNMFDIVKP